MWGFENSAIFEKVELQYFKLLLILRKSTPNYMIYGELGRLPISITIKPRLISFWGKLIIGKELNYPTGFTISIAKTMNQCAPDWRGLWPQRARMSRTRFWDDIR